MNELSPDFGTGLRAHLGLDAAQLALAAEPVAPPPQQPVAELVEDEVGDEELDRLDALAALETELLEREHFLSMREASLASRAGSLLATAQALYDEVLSGGLPARHDDELSRLRRRKSVA
jgi:hypothetical protein